MSHKLRQKKFLYVLYLSQDETNKSHQDKQTIFREVIHMKKLKIYSSAGVSTGRKNVNEDNFYRNGQFLMREERDQGIVCSGQESGELLMYAICDGFGGKDYGDEASLIMVKVLEKYQSMLNDIKYHDLDKYMVMCFNEANNLIFELAKDKQNEKMGTTIAAAVIENQKVHVYNVGDSRVYRLRKNKLTQLTEDHTQAARAVKLGMFKEDDEQIKKFKNRLTQYLGIWEKQIVAKPFAGEFAPENADVILICSNGLYNAVDNEEIKQMLKSDLSESEIVKNLIERATINGGKDNISAVVLKIKAEKM